MSWRAQSGLKLKKKHASPSVTMGAALPMIVGSDKLVAFAAGIRFVNCRLHELPRRLSRRRAHVRNPCAPNACRGPLRSSARTPWKRSIPELHGFALNRVQVRAGAAWRCVASIEKGSNFHWHAGLRAAASMRAKRCFIDECTPPGDTKPKRCNVPPVRFTCARHCCRTGLARRFRPR